MGKLAERFEGKVGDLYYTSWGYDQTNYDYLIVVSISASGKSVICQRARSKNVGFSGCCNEQKIIREGYGNTFRMKVIGARRLCGSYIFCGTDSKRFDYFSEASENRSYYETAAQYGH